MKKINLFIMILIVAILSTGMFSVNANVDGYETYLTTDGLAKDRVVLEKLDVETTVSGRKVPANTLKLTTTKTGSGQPEDSVAFKTKVALLDMNKPVYIKWMEELPAGDCLPYYFGIESTSTADPFGTASEFTFSTNWGSAVNDVGSLKVTLGSKGRPVASIDGAKTNVPRTVWNNYQIKIEFNKTTSKFDVFLSTEGHDGSSQNSNLIGSVEESLDTFKNGAYFYMMGHDHVTHGPNLHFLPSADGFLPGSSFMTPSIISTGLSLDSSKISKDLNFDTDLDLSKLVVKSLNNLGGETVLTQGENGYTIDMGTFDKKKAGTYTIKIKYLDFEESISIKVNEKIEEKPIDKPEEKSSCSTVLNKSGIVGLGILIIGAFIFSVPKKKNKA